MADIHDNTNWSEIDNNNNQPSPAGWPEGMMPSGVNDSARAVMGAVKRFYDRINATVTSGGSPNAQTLAYAVPPTALVKGDVFTFIPSMNNTGATTLNVGVGGALPLLSAGLPLTANTLVVGRPVMVSYADAGIFQIVSSGGGSISVNNGGEIDVTGGGDLNVYGGGGTDLNVYAGSEINIANGGGLNVGSPSPATNAAIDLRVGGSAPPVNSGTVQSAGLIARMGDNSGMICDMGGNGGLGFWLDVTNSGDLSQHYPLLLNQNGGAVAVGPGGLGVGGDINTNGTYYLKNTKFAEYDGFTTLIYPGGGNSAIGLQPGVNLYDNNSHIFRNDALGQIFIIDSAGNTQIGGTLNTGAGITLNSGNVTLNNGNLSVLHGQVYSAGPTAGYLFEQRTGGGPGWQLFSDVGTLHLNNGVDRFLLDAAGNGNFSGSLGLPGTVTAGGFSTTGTVTAGGFSTTGTVTATTAVDTTTYRINGIRFADTDGTVTRLYSPPSGSAAAIDLVSNANFYTNDTHVFRNDVPTNVVVIDSGGNGTFNGNISAATVTGSIAVNTNVYRIGGGRFADSDGFTTSLYPPGGSPSAIGIQANATLYDNDMHYFRNNATGIVFTIDSSGNTVIGGTVTGSSDATFSGQLKAAGTSAGVLFANRGGGPDWQWYSNSGTARLFLSGSGDRFTIDPSGNVSVLGQISTTGHIIPVATGAYTLGDVGHSWANVFAVTYTTTSDPALKQDIAEPPPGALARVMATPVKQFHWRDEDAADPLHWGWLAPEVREALGPGFAGYRPGDGPGQQGLVVNEMVAVLWRAVQELTQRLDAKETLH